MSLRVRDGLEPGAAVVAEKHPVPAMPPVGPPGTPLELVLTLGLGGSTATAAAAARLWCPEDPHLYGLEVVLREDDAAAGSSNALDSVDSCECALHCVGLAE